MFTTIKNRLARWILVASITIILTAGPIASTVLASPTCGVSVPGC